MEVLVPAISIIVFSVPSYYFLVKSVGIKKAFLCIAMLSFLAFCIETLALQTGFPYGKFEYKQNLNTNATLGLPWPVLFAWPPLVIGAVALAKRQTSTLFTTAILATAYMVTLDLIFDPVAVSLGFWKYVHGGIYYQVPYTNFLGWIVSSFIGVYVFLLLLKKDALLLKTSTTFFLYLVLWTGIAVYLDFSIPVIIGVIFLLWTWAYICRGRYRSTGNRS